MQLARHAHHILNQALEKAERHHQMGKTAVARDICLKILHIKPDHAKALHMCGLLAAHGQDAATALRFFDRSIQLSPDFADAHLHRAMVVQALGHIDDAVAGYETTIRINANDVQARFMLAELLLQQGLHERAHEQYQYLTRLQPRMVEAHQRLATIHVARREMAKAIQVFKTICRLQSDSAQAHYNLGLIYTSCDMYAKAAAAFRQAVLIEPDYPEAWQYLGQALHKAGRPRHAMKALQTARTQNPDNPGIIFQMAEIHRLAGRIQQALALFKTLLNISPGHIEARNNIGLIYLQQREFTQAETVFQRLVNEHDELPQAHYNLGLAFHRQGNLKGAEHAYRAAVDRDPQNADALNNLGLVLRLQNRVHESIHAFRQAVAANPGLGMAYYNLGNELESQGLLQEAVQCYERALAIDGQNQVIRHQLAALTGQKTPQAPRQYITSLFDQYAVSFEQDLVKNLKYHVPEKLGDLVSGFARNRSRFARGVDLGCGTGLCGRVFGPITGHLTGVDLSTEMIAKARQSGRYAALVQDDAIAYLTGTSEKFDLFVAADLFIYIGDLAETFKAVQSAAAPKACFTFSVEAFQGEDYELRTSGRYAQSDAYIRKLARENGFEVKACQNTGIRKELNQWIDGRLYLLESQRT